MPPLTKDRFESYSLQRRVQCEPDFLPLNSRYFRPVRRKETRARRWDLQFESTSLQRGVHCEPDILCSDPDAVLNHTPVRKLVAVRLTQSNFDWIKAVARYAGLTGSSEESGAKRREQGLARAGSDLPARRLVSGGIVKATSKAHDNKRRKHDPPPRC